MEPKMFDDLDEMERWAEKNPNKVSRHILKAWREIIEEDEDFIIIVKCKPKNYHEDMNIIVERGGEEEALETLLQEAIEREDYEIAREITNLQDKI